MDHWLDGLAKSMAGQTSRRGALKQLGAGLAAAALGSVLPRPLHTEAAATCLGGQAACPDGCVDTSADRRNCGACGHVCPSLDLCCNGRCVSVKDVPPGTKICGGRCANIATDPNNCGGCGHACAAGMPCTDGLCFAPTLLLQSVCASGQMWCSGECTDILFSHVNCGGCNRPCLGGVLCSNGQCLSLPPDALSQQTPGAPAPGCQSNAIQSATAPNQSVSVTQNGLTITAVAAGGSGAFTLAFCTTNPGPSPPVAATALFDLRAAAGSSVPALGAAIAFFDLRVAAGSSFGSLSLTICPAAGSALFWLTSANVWQPVSPTPAATAPDCLTMTVTQTSSPRLSDLTGTTFVLIGGGCNGQAVNLQTDPNNCGACGHACGNSARCANGVCSCFGPATLCGGVCTDTRTDNKNCGACGHACLPSQTCQNGICIGGGGAGCIPPNDLSCGGGCCNSQSEDCCGGVCCRLDVPCCEGVCCGPGFGSCQSGQCCRSNQGRDQGCNGACCPPGEKCAAPVDSTTGLECCPEKQVCPTGGAIPDCCPQEKTCATSQNTGAPACCLNKRVCDGLCCFDDPFQTCVTDPTTGLKGCCAVPCPNFVQLGGCCSALNPNGNVVCVATDTCCVAAAVCGGSCCVPDAQSCVNVLNGPNCRVGTCLGGTTCCPPANTVGGACCMPDAQSCANVGPNCKVGVICGGVCCQAPSSCSGGQCVSPMCLNGPDVCAHAIAGTSCCGGAGKCARPDAASLATCCPVAKYAFSVGSCCEPPGVVDPVSGLCCDSRLSPTCSISDRNLKQNFAEVDPRTVLERVAALPVTTWNYTFEPPAVRHMGPMAQDFAAAFGVGDDDRHIHLLDGQGVALAAIQGLLLKMEQERSEQQRQVAALEAQNAALQSRLEAIERGAMMEPPAPGVAGICPPDRK